MEGANDNQFLAFGMDGEIFAIPVFKVREVLEYLRPVRLPKTAAFLKGIINVRGTAIPVVDLRVRFGMPELPVSKDSAIIVTEISREGEASLVIGALTDEVHEVIELDEGSLEPAPRFGGRIDSSFIKNIGKKDDRFVVILDIDRVFSEDEATVLEEAQAMPA
ncbi:MAG TPA: chemotaxis protein CheW [Spirochaetaceae bacterium]|jgi:purine-binding chemotaxis protein CheW|nr:chemotaxis protein CheW [Spirochaetaceae bacterium]